MSEPVAKQRPMIDIDEFERRLRPAQTVQRRQTEDPLAELARLVHNDEDPYQNVFQDYPGPDNHGQNYQGQNYQGQNYQGQDHRGQDYRSQSYRGQVAEDPRAPVRRVEPAMPRIPSATALNTQAPRGFQAERVMPQAPGFQPQAPQQTQTRAAPQNPNLGGNFAAIEAGLRGSFQPDFRQPDFRQPDFRGPSAVPPPAAHEDDDDHWLDHAQAPLPQATNAVPMHEPSRSNRLLYLTAAVILLGAGGIGATFAIKRTPASPQQIAMIKASTTPAKIQAPKPTDNSLAMQDASVLDKTPQPSPTGVVNRTEQPVDLSVTGPKPQTPSPTSASSVPVPTPPTESAPWQAPPSSVSGNPQVADASGAQAYSLDGMIKSRKVKTVAVRPDGSVVAEDPPAPAAAAPAAKPAEAPPARVASNEPAQMSSNAASDPSPISAPKGRTEARGKPVKVANVDPAGTPDDDEDAGSGAAGFSVQLAAAPSAGEAEHVMNKLAQKYSVTLAGHKLKFRRAKVNDKSVFRVRVGGLTKGGAVKLCEALKSKGGSCFVAHD